MWLSPSCLVLQNTSASYASSTILQTFPYSTMAVNLPTIKHEQPEIVNSPTIRNNKRDSKATSYFT